MIAAALIATYLIFFGGGTHAPLGDVMSNYVKEQIEVAIEDGERRELALQGLSVVEDDISDLNKAVTTGGEQLEALIKDYNSKPEEFDQLFASLAAERHEQAVKLWDDRQAMLTHIEPDEWRAIMEGATTAAKEKD